MAEIVCYGFSWQGPHSKPCAVCDRPYWEHTHEEHFREGRLFRKVISKSDRKHIKNRVAKRNITWVTHV